MTSPSDDVLTSRTERGGGEVDVLAGRGAAAAVGAAFRLEWCMIFTRRL